ncbi:MAG: hypothetical protein HN353_08405 [Bdellovibrionales bacterium]|jgi:hypothetical protein|nr:hypothetical protein [Bdellovibrionales bacterium]MBT3526561.1 hypothetical protein [Bdellovibrionales bacterium]MBT7668941.1 hypothetical protein [Bdellovibrionales bacterium]MBT7767948.1 hypothetical protein [Bdellovibrionales bacterium]
MIYGSSKDQVLVKKINLKVWSLRDEIESVIDQQVKGGADDSQKLDLDDITKEYTGKVPIDMVMSKQNINSPSESTEETSDQAEGDEAEAKQEAETDDDTEGTEEAMAKAMLEGQVDQDAEKGLYQIKQRVPALPPEKVGHAKAILSEIWIDHMLLFSSINFLIGQSVVVEFVVPQPFSLNGTISSCRVCNPKSRIISEQKLAYRIAIAFSFLKAGERSILRTFLGSIEPDKVTVEPLVAVPDTDDTDDDDDDDLSDLGL